MTEALITVRVLLFDGRIEKGEIPYGHDYQGVRLKCLYKGLRFYHNNTFNTVYIRLS